MPEMTLKEHVKKIFVEETDKGIKGSIDRIMKRAKEEGINIKYESVSPDIERYEYEKIWESEIATRYNKEVNVLAAQFFTLYWREEGAGQGWGCGGFYPIPEMFFIFGRVGNTRCISFSF